MADPRPELVVVAGDQMDTRVVLMTDEAFVGRAADCELQILDTTVSRKHLRFLLAPGGWLVENVSTNPIRINGKGYKNGRRIFLETGDTICVGVETELLFISPGEDPNAAIAAYREANPLPGPVEARRSATRPPTSFDRRLRSRRSPCRMSTKRNSPRSGRSANTRSWAASGWA